MNVFAQRKVFLPSKRVFLFIGLIVVFGMPTAWAAGGNLLVNSTTEDPSVADPDNKGNQAGAALKNQDNKLNSVALIVPRYTKIPIVMDTNVNGDTSMEGDEFWCRTAEDLVIDGSLVVPTGSLIKGRISLVADPKEIKRTVIGLKFDTLAIPGNREVALAANPVCRGGVLHVRRGLTGISIEACRPPLPMLLGTAISSCGSKPAKGSHRSAIKKVEKPVTADNFVWPPGCEIALFAKKGRTIDIRVGDELKIELTEDLKLPHDCWEQ